MIWATYVSVTKVIKTYFVHKLIYSIPTHVSCCKCYNSPSCYSARLNHTSLYPTQDEIISSSYVTAHYLKYIVKYTGKVYTVGPQGLAQELDAVGIPNFGTGVRVNCMFF